MQYVFAALLVAFLSHANLHNLLEEITDKGVTLRFVRESQTFTTAKRVSLELKSERLYWSLRGFRHHPIT